MISVQNHLRRLSGSNIGLFLLVLILLISCGAFRKTPTVEWPKDDEIVIEGKEEKTETSTGVESKPKNDSKKAKKQKYEIINFKGEDFRVPIHDHSFNIAIILPFHSDSSNSSRDSRRANLMLEYYQGMLLAVPSIEKLQSTFNIKYYDSDNDTAKLRQILRMPEFENVDLILGPTDEGQVKIAAYFARQRKIPLLSPISTMEEVWSNNPYLFFANPSERMQAKQFLKYFKREHKDEKLLIVRDGKGFDKTFGAALVQECIEQNINFEKIAYSGRIKWNNHLGTDKTVVLHTGTSKTSMTYAVTGLLSKADKVTLIGGDEWLNFSSVDYSQLEKLNVTYLSVNKAQIPNKMAQDLYSSYITIYNGVPSWFVYKGYDQLLLSCELLDAFGSYFPLFIEGKSISYANSDFNFQKFGNCFQNEYLELFKLQERELIRVD